MKKVSNAQRKKNAEIARLKSILMKEPYCIICGSPRNLEYAHLLPKGGLYAEYYLHPQNGVLLCHECHKQYDNNLLFRREQKRLYDKICEFSQRCANAYFGFNH
jgi:hypothetical protein